MLVGFSGVSFIWSGEGYLVLVLLGVNGGDEISSVFGISYSNRDSKLERYLLGEWKFSS